ncbi:MAG: MMPL family transporter [Chitinispirillia bacterium]
MNFLAQGIFTHKKKIIFISIAFTIVCSFFLFNVKFTDNHRHFFKKTSKDLKEIEFLENIYGKNNSLLIAIIPANGNVFHDTCLFLIKELQDSINTLPGLKSNTSILNYKTVKLQFTDISFHDLITVKQQYSDSEIIHFKDNILKDSLFHNKLISPRGNATGIHATFNISDKITADIIHSDVTSILMSIRQKYPYYPVYITGGIVIDASFFKASFSDAALRIPLLYSIVFVIVMWITSSLWAAFSIICIVLFPSLISVSLGSMFGIVLTPPSSMAPIIILTVGLADSIHLFITYSHHIRQKKHPKLALEITFKKIFWPVTITSITTVVGFLTLTFSPVPPFRDLGIITAMGIFFAYTFSLFFLPSLIFQFFPLKTTRYTKKHDMFGVKLGCHVSYNSKIYMYLFFGFMIVLTFGIRYIEFDDTFFKFFSPEYRFRQDTEKIISNLTGLDYVDCSISLSNIDVKQLQQELLKLDSITVWLREQPEIIHVIGATDIIKRAYQKISPSGYSKNVIPGDKLLLKILKNYRKYQEANEIFPNLLTPDFKNYKVTITVGDISSKQLRSLEGKIRNIFNSYFQGKYPVIVNSTSLMFAHLSKRNIISMLQSSVLAVILIGVLLIAATRKISIGILSLIPNILPIFISFGVWGFCFKEAGIGISVVTAMTMGIIVDDTIHILYSWLQAEKKGMKKQNAIVYAFRHVADAVIVTSFILIIGFLSLGNSAFQPTAQMGVMTSIIIIIALVTDIFLLPSLFMLFEKFIFQKKEFVNHTSK